MVIELLAPCMKDGGNADAGTKMFGISGKGTESLGCCFEQQSIDHGLVLKRDRSNRRRKREYHVEIGYGQQFRFARREPSCGRRNASRRNASRRRGTSWRASRGCRR